jgi:hypothetical protein
MRICRHVCMQCTHAWQSCMRCGYIFVCIHISMCTHTHTHTHTHTNLVYALVSCIPSLAFILHHFLVIFSFSRSLSLSLSLSVCLFDSLSPWLYCFFTLFPSTFLHSSSSELCSLSVSVANFLIHIPVSFFPCTPAEYIDYFGFIPDLFSAASWIPIFPMSMLLASSRAGQSAVHVQKENKHMIATCKSVFHNNRWSTILMRRRK